MARYFTEKSRISEAAATAAISQWTYKLETTEDLDPLMQRIGQARIVMLGEASHGTHEYYAWRARISQRLILEKGFQFIAVEGDWPDCYRLNRYIKNYPDGGSQGVEVLRGFNRWPTWMWANWEMVAMIEWLRKHNDGLRASRVGFYGLDVYSLWESMESIIDYLGRVDPVALETARDAYRCFEPYREDEGRSYARASRLVPELCEAEVVRLLREIRMRMPKYNTDPENVFNAEQNALVAMNAEKYYRAMIRGGPHSWNVRDRHMSDTLSRLLDFHGKDSKAIIWAHNTHIGDARATDMVNEGMYNIGELARTRYGENEVVLVGFGSYAGTVIAGNHWGDEMRKVEMPEAIPGSWEQLLHSAPGSPGKLLILEDLARDDVFMENHIGHRAIGVVYDPRYEKYGNYVPSILPLRYDAFAFLDRTSALHPLHIQPDGRQIPETYPFGV